MNKTTTPIQRSNSRNVPLEYLEGKRLLSIQEAEALQKGCGLSELDPELFVWSKKRQKFSPGAFGGSPHIVTYATTRPEGYYVNATLYSEPDFNPLTGEKL